MEGVALKLLLPPTGPRTGIKHLCTPGILCCGRTRLPDSAYIHPNQLSQQQHLCRRSAVRRNNDRLLDAFACSIPNMRGCLTGVESLGDPGLELRPRGNTASKLS